MGRLPQLLTDPWFEAEFYGEVADQGQSYRRHGSRIDGAQGLFLWCPCHYGDARRGHGLIIPFANPRNAPEVPPEHGPHSARGDAKRPRWRMSGTGLSDLTLAPSVAVGKPECWHGFIQNGVVK